MKIPTITIDTKSKNYHQQQLSTPLCLTTLPQAPATAPPPLPEARVRLLPDEASLPIHYLTLILQNPPATTPHLPLLAHPPSQSTLPTAVQAAAAAKTLAQSTTTRLEDGNPFTR